MMLLPVDWPSSAPPQQQFLGFDPPGTPIAFAEHVFYRFCDSKIAEVWSVIDTQAIAAQTAH